MYILRRADVSETFILDGYIYTSAGKFILRRFYTVGSVAAMAIEGGGTPPLSFEDLTLEGSPHIKTICPDEYCLVICDGQEGEAFPVMAKLAADGGGVDELAAFVPAVIRVLIKDETLIMYRADGQTEVMRIGAQESEDPTDITMESVWDVTVQSPLAAAEITADDKPAEDDLSDDAAAADEEIAQVSLPSRGSRVCHFNNSGLYYAEGRLHNEVPFAMVAFDTFTIEELPLHELRDEPVPFDSDGFIDRVEGFYMRTRCRVVRSCHAKCVAFC